MDALKRHTVYRSGIQTNEAQRYKELSRRGDTTALLSNMMRHHRKFDKSGVAPLTRNEIDQPIVLCHNELRAKMQYDYYSKGFG